jgi:ketosteroid isomerase-like protein
MRSRFGLLLLALSLVIGCKGQPAQDASETPQPVAPAQPTEAELKKPAAAKAPTPIAQEAVKALVDAWLAAQNKGDFAAYSGLYAAKFFGVKRAGQREERFDRERWLKDRQKMFQKPISVEMNDLQVRASSASADVALTQHWTSGKFEDMGPKRLLVVREDGALKIAQEEMLQSEVLPKKAKHDALGFYFTLSLNSGLYLSLPNAKVPEKLGPLVNERSEKDTEVFTASRSVEAAELDPGVSALQAAKLRVEGGCDAKITEFRALTRVVPHFAERSDWTGAAEGKAKSGAALAPEQVAAAVWALGQPSLFAKLEGCSEGRFAWRAAEPQPLAAEPVEDAELAERALAAFGKLPSVRATQKDFLKQASNAEGDWWGEATEVAIFKHPKSGQVLVSVLANLKEGCGEFTASEWAVFEQKGKALKRVSPSQRAPDRISDALDVDGDGRLEFLGETDFGTDIVLLWPDGNEAETSLKHAFLDCPC